MLTVHDFASATSALQAVATQYAERTAQADPQSAIGYRAIARRAAQFMGLRGE